jgi:ribosomal protein S18 acetylase RimI-like enzyme
MLSGNKEEEYINLVFERIDDASVLSNFYCGIDEMDEFIHNKLQDYLNKTGCDTYTIKQGDEIVAMLSLGEDTLSLDDDDKDDMRSGFVPKPNIALDNKDFFAEKEFPAIEIAYLAVKKEKRKQGIGEYIISQVEEKAQRDNPECEFLTVEAYKTKKYSAVGFYSKCDFTPAEVPLCYKDTLRMYKVLHPTSPQE